MYYRYADCHLFGTQVRVDELVEQSSKRHNKPIGLWFTDGSDESWYEYCKNAGWYEKVTHKHELSISYDANLYKITDYYSGEHFTQLFATPESHKMEIDWQAVYAAYDGITLFPYTKSNRWMESWSCASGCIWNTRVITNLALVEVKNKFQIAAEDEKFPQDFIGV